MASSGFLRDCLFPDSVLALHTHLPGSPPSFGCSTDPCSGSGAHGPLLARVLARPDMFVLTGKKSADLPKHCYLGADVGEDIGVVHAD